MKNKISGKRKISAALTVIGFISILFCVFFLSDGKFNLSGVNSGFDTEQDFVRVIDVGQGDCSLIYSNGYSALIDTGTPEAANDVCAQLSECNIKEIDVLIITHLHDDHSGGVGKIAEIFDIKNVILPEISIESEGLTSAELIVNRVTESGGGVFTAKPGMNFGLGEFEITVLAAYDNMKDENNRSIISMAKIGDKKFMFTGDAEAKVEKELLNEGLDLSCDVFNAGHHGSSTSNTYEFLKAMKPEYVAISAGRDNSYGHPHKEALAIFERVGADIFRTDYDGDITFYVNNGRISPKTEK